jgi:hypothetical protein
VPAPTARLVARIKRDFSAGAAHELASGNPARWDDVIGYLTGLKIQEYGGQDPERMQAALVLSAGGDWDGFLAAVELLRLDWRDLLVAAGLAHGDWPERLDRELPTA